MVPPETAWIDVERVDDLTFSVQASGRDGAVGVRFVTGGGVVVTDPEEIQERADAPRKGCIGVDRVAVQQDLIVAFCRTQPG